MNSDIKDLDNMHISDIKIYNNQGLIKTPKKS